MKLTVIGKYGPYPAKGGGTSCYLLRTAQTAIALDFGCGALSGLPKFVPLNKLDAVFLTHFHYDHTADILPFVYYAQTNQMRPSVYCPFGLDPILETIRAEDKFNLFKISGDITVQLGDLSFTFCRMPHLVESYAIRICDGKTTFVYSGDLSDTDALLPFCKNADVILMDCSGGAVHASLEDAVQVADITRARIIATHFSPLVHYRTDQSNIELAQEGKTYQI